MTKGFYWLANALLLFASTAAHAQCIQNVDFYTWVETGDEGGSWVIQQSGSEVVTNVNTSFPTLFISPDTLMNVRITGTFRSEDYDNDFLGFVFSFQQTPNYAWAGTSYMYHEYHLFDWKQGQQTFNGATGMEGFSLDYVDGNFQRTQASVAPSFWGHTNSATFNVLQTMYGSGLGWSQWTDYDFELLLTPTQAVILIDTDTIFDQSGCFEPGQFGFYNYSQPGARYWNFNYELYINFMLEDQHICVGDTARMFFSSSAGCNNYNSFTNIQNFHWDLGDNTVTSDTNPEHVYTQPGTYTVMLVGTDVNGCTDTAYQSIYVQGPLPVEIDFDNVCLGDTMHFADITQTQSGNIVGWQWDFGDNSAIDTTETPVHYYTQSGYHTVTLIVENLAGCSDTTDTVVHVFPPPQPDFSIENACIGDVVELEDFSMQMFAPIVQLEWDVDNNGTTDYNSALVSHMFSSNGTYPVFLRVTDSIGCRDSIVKLCYTHPAPVADFGVEAECLGDGNHFSDSSTVLITQVVGWAWDFGDGTTSTMNNPTHVYQSPGVYTAQLAVATDSGCLDTTTGQVTVYHLPVADFTLEPVCANLPATFIQTSGSQDGMVVGWLWDFGDSNTSTTASPMNQYTQPGLFNVTLEVESQYGCTDTAQRKIRVYPPPMAAFAWTNVCEGVPVQFTNQSIIQQYTPNGDVIVSWQWFVNGISTFYIPDPVLATTEPAEIGVELIVTSNYGCEDSAFARVLVHDVPEAIFDVDPACSGHQTHFDDASLISGSVAANWYWSFGDGQSSTEQHPVYVFQHGGYHHITLWVESNKGCSGETQKTIFIPESPTAEFFPHPAEGCSPLVSLMENFTFISSGSITYKWYLDGLPYSSEREPEIGMTNDTLVSEPHLVHLVAESDQGCATTTDTREIVVLPAPTAAFNMRHAGIPGFDRVVEFENTSAHAAYWKWNFGDGQHSGQFSPNHEYERSGFYEVIQTAYNEFGCSDSAKDFVEIAPVDLMYVPNAFTPNGDGINDVWSIRGFNEDNAFRIRVADRWGHTVFESDNLDFSWDGVEAGSGRLLPGGTYAFIIAYYTSSMDYKEIKGEVIIVR